MECPACRPHERLSGGPEIPARLAIRELRASARFVGTVAGWLHGQWYGGQGRGMEAVVERLLAEPQPEESFRRCFVASLHDEEPVGSFILEETAHPVTAQVLFCLSNVFVAPARRGRGIGRQLCEAAVAQARMRGVRSLSLFTASHGAWYAGLGWRYEELVNLRAGGRQQPALLMSRDLDR
jgi:predicted N-acetyltransferase YhbS